MWSLSASGNCPNLCYIARLRRNVNIIWCVINNITSCNCNWALGIYFISSYNYYSCSYTNRIVIRFIYTKSQSVHGYGNVYLARIGRRSLLLVVVTCLRAKFLRLAAKNEYRGGGGIYNTNYCIFITSIKFMINLLL